MMKKGLLICGMLFLTSASVFAQESPKNANKEINSTKKLPAVRTMIIGPERLQCIGIMQTGDCYQFKKDKNQKDWESFPYQIKGFKHQKGYEYVISVKVTKPKVALEGATEEYTFLKTISKKKVK